MYLALEQDLTIIPVINKIDLPAADVSKTKQEIIELLGCDEPEIILASGKTGEGVEEVLDRVITSGPEPKTDKNSSSRALIFDSNYDKYKGVVTYVRITDGSFSKGDRISLVASKSESEILDIGVFKPQYQATGKLETGMIGYIITGFKEVSQSKVGDTITLSSQISNCLPLAGYKEVKPMVFAGIFPKEGSDWENLREAVEKLKLNDASLVYETEHSEALGFGLRCGFLGLLHLEIFQERLRREYNLDIIVTIPSVAYKVKRTDGSEEIIRSPSKMPQATRTLEVEEPWVSLDVITPQEYLGSLMQLIQEKRGEYINTEYINTGEGKNNRAILHYNLPLSVILTDFYDKIKSVSSGYASINYEYSGYRKADVVKMDILVAEEIIESLSLMVYRDEAFKQGKEIVKILRDSLPKQMFVIKLQAAVGSKVVAAERLSAMRKDVTAKLYGGDVSRKRKLLEKQKKGKKKMMKAGRGSVDIPPETFVKILKR